MHGCGPVGLVTADGSAYIVTSKQMRSRMLIHASIGKSVQIEGVVYRRSGFSLLVADSLKMPL
jgi:hypothetical protein